MTTEILKAIDTGPIVIRAVRRPNVFTDKALFENLANLSFGFPVPAIDAAYKAGDKLVAGDHIGAEPLFAAEFERAVVDDAIREIAPEVGRLLTEAINRRLPWSTQQTGWRIYR